MGFTMGKFFMMVLIVRLRPQILLTMRSNRGSKRFVVGNWQRKVPKSQKLGHVLGTTKLQVVDMA